MGWHKENNLRVENATEKVDVCSLWSRGGLNGIEIHIFDKIIHIPRQLIIDLVASEYINNRISKLEQMDTEEVIKEMGL